MDIMTNDAAMKQKIKTNNWLMTITWLIVIAGISATVAVWLLAKPVATQTQTTPEGFAVQGVAINQTSGYVDYGNLATNGIDFAYLRATTGTSFFDDGYQSSYSRAEAAKLKVGAIQVFDNSIDAADQTQYFISHVAGHVGELPIAVYVTNDQVATQASQSRLASVIRLLAAHYDKSVVIYTTPAVKKKLSGTIHQANYWLIEDDTRDRATDNQFIQYSEDHTIGTGLKAIKMPTSVFNGTRKQFEAIK